MEGVVIVLIIFATFFGLCYLYYSTRHKERMFLIEKGSQADIFFGKKKNGPAQIWKVFVINLAMLAIGIGLGLILAFQLFEDFNHHSDPARVGTVFVCAGLGLLGGFFITNKFLKQD